MELLYEGKAKQVYRRGGLYVLVFKDVVTAGDGVKRDAAPGKGALAAETTALLLQRLEAAGVATHYVAYEPPNAIVAKPADVVPLEVIVRFKAYGSQLKRMPRLAPLQPFSKPLVELHFKDDKLHDPLVLEEEALEAGLVTAQELEYIKFTSVKAATVLKSLYAKAGCDLVDIKFEYGRAEGRLLLIDEVSGDTFRLLCGGEHLDKEYYRKTGDVLGLLERYRKLLQITKSLA
ncbi:MAG: phosphoribosylaminoimidazolesuccinocarboxamide synthase [Pyrobaculum sp.]